MKRLIGKATVFMATIAMSFAIHAATYYGLFVGVNEYSDPDDYLYGCDWDAVRMMDAYTRGGFCDAAHAELVTNLSATKETVREKFATLAETAKSGDTVLYFQSSHGGCEVDSDDNETKDAYLCLTDDDWSDAEQLDLYLQDLTGQGYSLTYGLYDDAGELIGISLGYIKHWYSGTEYIINELCIRTERQGAGAGTFFIREIEKTIRELGIKQIFLLTDSNVPAYEFYRKNGFTEQTTNVSFSKRV